MRTLVLALCVAVASGFVVAPTPSSAVVRSAVSMFSGASKSSPKKAAKKAPKKAAKKVAKKVVKKVNKKTSGAEPNFIQKIFAMPLIGGAQGVDLGPEYDL